MYAVKDRIKITFDLVTHTKCIRYLIESIFNTSSRCLMLIRRMS